jgi:ribosome-binding protein aMBF1 (putative translation factor)
MTNRRTNRRKQRSLQERLAAVEARLARAIAEKKRLLRLAKAANAGVHRSQSVPSLPQPDADGNYPAAETVQVILAQQIRRRRQAAGWTQADLAAKAGVRQETISRLEGGKHAPNVRTVDKIDRALEEAGT